MLQAARKNAEFRNGGITWNYRGQEDYLLLTRNILKIDNLSFSDLGDLVIAVDLDQVVGLSNQATSLYNHSKYIVSKLSPVLSCFIIFLISILLVS